MPVLSWFEQDGLDSRQSKYDRTQSHDVDNPLSSCQNSPSRTSEDWDNTKNMNFRLNTYEWSCKYVSKKQPWKRVVMGEPTL